MFSLNVLLGHNMRLVYLLSIILIFLEGCPGSKKKEEENKSVSKVIKEENKITEEDETQQVDDATAKAAGCGGCYKQKPSGDISRNNPNRKSKKNTKKVEKVIQPEDDEEDEEPMQSDEDAEEELEDPEEEVKVTKGKVKNPVPINKKPNKATLARKPSPKEDPVAQPNKSTVVPKTSPEKVSEDPENLIVAKLVKQGAQSTLRKRDPIQRHDFELIPSTRQRLQDDSRIARALNDLNKKPAKKTSSK
jgi:hypothetical protein